MMAKRQRSVLFVFGFSTLALSLIASVFCSGVIVLRCVDYEADLNNGRQLQTQLQSACEDLESAYNNLTQYKNSEETRLNDRIAQLAQRFAQLEAKYSARTAELEPLEQQHNALTAKIQQLQKDKESQTSELKALEDAIAEKQTLLAKLEASRVATEKANTALSQRQDELTRELGTLERRQEQLTEVKEQYPVILQKLADLRNEQTSLCESVASLTGQATALKEQTTVAEAELRKTGDELTKLRSEHAAATLAINRMGELDTLLPEAEQKLTQATAACTEAEVRTAEYNRQVENSKATLRQLKDDVATQSEKLALLKNEISKLSSQRDALVSATEVCNISLKAAEVALADSQKASRTAETERTAAEASAKLAKERAQAEIAQYAKEREEAERKTREAVAELAKTTAEMSARQQELARLYESAKAGLKALKDESASAPNAK